MKVQAIIQCLFIAVASVASFTAPARYNNQRKALGLHQKMSVNERTILFSTEESESEKSDKAVVPEQPSAPVAQEPESTSYPIDLPSPILLSVSMILAIIGTGKGTI